MCLLTSMHHEWHNHRMLRRKQLPLLGLVHTKVGGTRAGEVPRHGGVTDLTIKSLSFSWSCTHWKWDIPPRQVTRVPGDGVRFLHVNTRLRSGVTRLTGIQYEITTPKPVKTHGRTILCQQFQAWQVILTISPLKSPKRWWNWQYWRRFKRVIE